ncbi:neprilysin-2-like [Physella acuta]|uniref:neprilysin-2-like n=1 Tax=Physella acuta TaxID=109671 RepID=UPI0027DE7EC2|nr:neprilysin-2-like [Physella acuta]XP_059162236.1 neprilysin-2-like [Physella acuta]
MSYKPSLLTAAMIIFMLPAGSSESNQTVDLSKLPHKIPEPVQEICNSVKCQYLAKQVVNLMKKSVNPCDDFYTYACGNYRPAMLNEISILDGLNRKNYDFLLDKLNSEVEESNYFSVKLAKIYYQSCMKEAKMEDNPQLMEVKNQFSKLWPSLNENYVDEKQDLSQLTNLLPETLGEPFYHIRQLPDSNNKDRYLIHIDYPEPSLFKRQFGISSHRKLYELYAKNFGKPSPAAAHDADEWAIFIDARNKLIHEPGTAGYVTHYSLTTLGEISQRFPKFNFKTLIELAYRDAGITITDSEPIAVRDTQYFQKLLHLVEDTESRTLVNAVMFEKLIWRTLHATTLLQQAYLTVFPTLHPWWRCYEELNRYFRESIIRLYEINKFPKTADSRNTVKEIVKMLIDYANTTVAERPLTHNTKMGFFKKLNKLKTVVGSEKNNLAFSKINEMYTGLTLDVNDYSSNRMHVRKRLQILERKQLRGVPKAFDKYQLFPLQAIAAYDAEKNKLYIANGLVQQPFFESNAPKIWLIAKIGIIANTAFAEILGEKGRNYDDMGNERGWVSPVDVNKFELQIVCMTYKYLQQIDNLTSFELNSNHAAEVKKVIKESLAVNLAFGAYHGIKYTDQKLPLGDLTTEQIFFILYAQNSCQLRKANNFYTKMRVNTALRNSIFFSATFNCTDTSPMGSPVKC